MEKKILVLTAAFILTAGWSMAQEAPVDAAVEPAPVAEVAAIAEEKAASVEVGNTICPISGEEIKEGEGEKIEYNGKIYNVCKLGKDMFEKNPADVIAKFEEFEAKAAVDASQVVDDAVEAPVPTEAAPEAVPAE